IPQVQVRGAGRGDVLPGLAAVDGTQHGAFACFAVGACAVAAGPHDVPAHRSEAAQVGAGPSRDEFPAERGHGAGCRRQAGTASDTPSITATATRANGEERRRLPTITYRRAWIK